MWRRSKIIAPRVSRAAARALGAMVVVGGLLVFGLSGSAHACPQAETVHAVSQQHSMHPNANESVDAPVAGHSLSATVSAAAGTHAGLTAGGNGEAPLANMHPHTCDCAGTSCSTSAFISPTISGPVLLLKSWVLLPANQADVRAAQTFPNFRPPRQPV